MDHLPEDLNEGGRARGAVFDSASWRALQAVWRNRSPTLNGEEDVHRSRMRGDRKTGESVRTPDADLAAMAVRAEALAAVDAAAVAFTLIVRNKGL
jgi:hypothetical protein